MKKAKEIGFMKKSAKNKWLVSLISKKLSLESILTQEDEESVINELKIIQTMEDNLLLNNSLLT